jgi:hypothetical protein
MFRLNPQRRTEKASNRIAEDPASNLSPLIEKGEQKANREPLRLETNVTHTKQTHELSSNREKVAVFHPAAPAPNAPPRNQKGEQKANREWIRLEFIVTHRKQKPESISNREKVAVFHPANPAPEAAGRNQKGEQKANRESLRLEINVTHTKQKPDLISNREKDACFYYHTPHNGQGPARLLRAPNEQDCLACHSGGSNISPGIPNVFAEFAKVGHPFPAGVNTHDAAESVVLNNNRHATCVDCHNGHPANQVTSFTPPPLLRPSQNGIAGVSAADGATTVYPAVNEYDNCLRCHGTSAGKVVNPIYGYLPARLVSSGDFLNVIPQFAISSTSSHPVMHVSNSALSQPSLLANMLDLDGLTQGRSTGVQIFCSDCHNSDDNREFGGTGPNGPHGTKWTHILERQYVASETTAPGQLITNLKPNPDLTVSGPYALCGKCHNLANVISNASFSEHARHINDGFSCSVCHTAHGMGGTSSTVSGERLVNFDVNVVATNDGPISYSRATNSCGLICHGHAHELSGPTVTRKHGTPLPRPLTQTWPQPWPPQSPRRE